MKKYMILSLAISMLATPSLAEQDNRDIQISVPAHTYVHVGEDEYKDCMGKVGDIKQSLLRLNKFQKHHGKCWQEMNKEINLEGTQLGIEAQYLENKIYNAASKHLIIKDPNHPVEVGRHKMNKLKYSDLHYRWVTGQPYIQMIKKDEGICALKGVSGSFNGLEDQAFIHRREDGYYWLEASAARQVRVEAICYKFNW